MDLSYDGNQRQPEFHAWASLVLGLKPSSYVELGSGSSGFFVKHGIRVITVDLLPNGLGNGTTHIQGDSHDFTIQAAVCSRLKGAPDIVFIDADHSNTAVRADFDLWWPVARIAVGFHDILMQGVQEFWDQISTEHPSVEILGRDHASSDRWQKNHQPNGRLSVGGIGVLFK